MSLPEAVLLFASVGRRTGLLVVSQGVIPPFLPPLILLQGTELPTLENDSDSPQTLLLVEDKMIRATTTPIKNTEERIREALTIVPTVLNLLLPHMFHPIMVRFRHDGNHVLKLFLDLEVWTSRQEQRRPFTTHTDVFYDDGT